VGVFSWGGMVRDGVVPVSYRGEGRSVSDSWDGGDAEGLPVDCTVPYHACYIQ